MSDTESDPWVNIEDNIKSIEKIKYVKFDEIVSVGKTDFVCIDNTYHHIIDIDHGIDKISRTIFDCILNDINKNKYITLQYETLFYRIIDKHKDDIDIIISYIVSTFVNDSFECFVKLLNKIKSRYLLKHCILNNDIDLLNKLYSYNYDIPLSYYLHTFVTNFYVFKNMVINSFNKKLDFIYFPMQFIDDDFNMYSISQQIKSFFSDFEIISSLNNDVSDINIFNEQELIYITKFKYIVYLLDNNRHDLNRCFNEIIKYRSHHEFMNFLTLVKNINIYCDNFINYVVKYSDYNMVELCYSVGFMWTNKSCLFATQNNNISVLKFIIENGGFWGDCRMIHSYMTLNHDIILFCHKYECPDIIYDINQILQKIKNL